MEIKSDKNWVERGYSSLFETYNTRNFTYDEAQEFLTNNTITKASVVANLLSNLRKQGMLEVSQDPSDARKKLYRMIPKEDQIAAILEPKGTLDRGELERLLKRAADLIRTRVDYKFILIPLFLKRISDKWEGEFEEAKNDAISDGYTEEEASLEAAKATYHMFDLPTEYLWENIRQESGRLPEVFSRALKEISVRNPELSDIFSTVEFADFARNEENSIILQQLVELFSEKRLADVSPDILGDAYEWILRYFAPQRAKEGEVYTPREVIRILVQALDPKPEMSVYDPASASNGMLIEAYNHVMHMEGKAAADRVFLFGQEANGKTLGLGKMNMYIHDIRNVQIELGDTLLYPKFKVDGGLRQFDRVVANPPWNQDGYGGDTLNGADLPRRFSYGQVNHDSADWVWVQHMLASANDSGRVAVVLDTGSLFRGGKELSVRSKILKADLLEAVVLTAEKLFYNTSAPGALLFFNKAKRADRRGKVLFVNGSRTFVRHPDVRKLNSMTPEQISLIAGTVREWREVEGFSRVVSFDEIEKQDMNLNVTLYVAPDVVSEEIDLARTWAELKEVDLEIVKTEKKLAGFLSELGVDV